MPEWMVESSQLSDVGQKRKHNEDYVGFYEPSRTSDLQAHGRLYVLADGVGGASAGDIASQYAVKKIISTSYPQDTDGEPDTRLRRMIEGANADIFAQNRDRSDHREMATTVVAIGTRRQQYRNTILDRRWAVLPKALEMGQETKNARDQPLGQRAFTCSHRDFR